MSSYEQHLRRVEHRVLEAIKNINNNNNKSDEKSDLLLDLATLLAIIVIWFLICLVYYALKAIWLLLTRPEEEAFNIMRTWNQATPEAAMPGLRHVHRRPTRPARRRL